MSCYDLPLPLPRTVKLEFTPIQSVTREGVQVRLGGRLGPPFVPERGAAGPQRRQCVSGPNPQVLAAPA